MTNNAIESHQRFCIYAGLIFAPLICAGLMIAGFFVPPLPSMDANAVAAMFAEDRTGIRIGILITTLAAPFLAFYNAALSHQIRRIAGGLTPLATAQTIAGACLLLEFIFPQMLWQAAAYRTDRAPEIVQVLNDVAWLCYVGVDGTAIVQMLVVALAILQDKRSEPLIPRWCGYLSLWSALGIFGGSFCVFVKSGPLAWNGIISWWLLVTAFFIWMLVMSWQMLLASCSVEEKQL
tara:strand:- start:414 stop:1118 length:705 start_codon:yes stop_codon:yes gene_type:complete